MCRIVLHDGRDARRRSIPGRGCRNASGIRHGSMVYGERPHGCAVHTHDAIAFCDFHRVRSRDRTF